MVGKQDLSLLLTVKLKPSILEYLRELLVENRLNLVPVGIHHSLSFRVGEVRIDFSFVSAQKAEAMDVELLLAGVFNRDHGYAMMASFGVFPKGTWDVVYGQIGTERFLSLQIGALAM